MKNKFNIGDIVTYSDVGGKLLGEVRTFTITLISKSEGKIFYYDNYSIYNVEESRLSLYVEPKPKVKKYLYAYTDGCGDCVMSRGFYKDEQEFRKFVSTTWLQRLDWSMIEVEE